MLIAQTTTTEVQRIVGDPLPSEVVVGAGVTLFLVIVVASLLVRRRSGEGSGRRERARRERARRERARRERARRERARRERD